MNLVHLRALLLILWRQGVVRSTRFVFWKRLYQLNKISRRSVSNFISTCAQAEHLLDYRRRVRTDIRRQVKALHEGPPPVPIKPRPIVTVTTSAVSLKVINDQTACATSPAAAAG
jgi:hypothetical protein